MLKMVIAKPIELTIVRAVPLISAWAFVATRVENSGESAITTIPQKRRKTIGSSSDPEAKTNGLAKQQMPDAKRAAKAILFTPNFCDKYPPVTQAGPPIPITKKDKNGMPHVGSSCWLP